MTATTATPKRNGKAPVTAPKPTTTKKPATQWLSADGADIPKGARVATVKDAPRAASGTVTQRHQAGHMLTVVGKDGKGKHVAPSTVSIVK